MDTSDSVPPLPIRNPRRLMTSNIEVAPSPTQTSHDRVFAPIMNVYAINDVLHPAFPNFYQQTSAPPSSLSARSILSATSTNNNCMRLVPLPTCLESSPVSTCQSAYSYNITDNGVEVKAALPMVVSPEEKLPRAFSHKPLPPLPLPTSSCRWPSSPPISLRPHSPPSPTSPSGNGKHSRNHRFPSPVLETVDEIDEPDSICETSQGSISDDSDYSNESMPSTLGKAASPSPSSSIKRDRLDALRRLTRQDSTATLTRDERDLEHRAHTLELLTRPFSTIGSEDDRIIISSQTLIDLGVENPPLQPPADYTDEEAVISPTTPPPQRMADSLSVSPLSCPAFNPTAGSYSTDPTHAFHPITTPSPSSPTNMATPDYEECPPSHFSWSTDDDEVPVAAAPRRHQRGTRGLRAGVKAFLRGGQQSGEQMKFSFHYCVMSLEMQSRL